MRKDVVQGMIAKEATLKTDKTGRQYAALTIEENRMKLLDNGMLKRTGRIFHYVTAYGSAKEDLMKCRKGDMVMVTGRCYPIRRSKTQQIAFNATMVKKYASHKYSIAA